jgi:hypothetical protein
MLARALTPLIVIAAVPLLCSAATASRPFRDHHRKSSRRSTFASSTLQRDSQRRSRYVVDVRTGQAAHLSQTCRNSLINGFLAGTPISLVVSFCFTPSVSAFVFQAWQCDQFLFSETEEHSFLGQDLSVRCFDSDDHRQIVAVAWILVGLWPVGMVALYAALLYPVRKELLTGDGASPLVSATAFLHRDYKVTGASRRVVTESSPPCGRMPPLLLFVPFHHTSRPHALTASCTCQASYYWWEIMMLLQRTVLTG